MSVAPEIPYSAYEPMLNLILIFLFASLVIVFLIFAHARHAAKKRLKTAERKIEEMKVIEKTEEEEEVNKEEVNKEEAEERKKVKEEEENKT